MPIFQPNKLLIEYVAEQEDENRSMVSLANTAKLLSLQDVIDCAQKNESPGTEEFDLTIYRIVRDTDSR